MLAAERVTTLATRLTDLAWGMRYGLAPAGITPPRLWLLERKRRRNHRAKKVCEVYVGQMIPRETRNVLRLLRALVVAWVLMSILILWLAVKAQTSGRLPSVEPRLSTKSRVSAGSNLANWHRGMEDGQRQCDRNHNRV